MLDTSNKKRMFNETPTILPNLASNYFATNVVSEEDQFKVRAGTMLSLVSRTEIVSAQDFGLDYMQLNQEAKIEIYEVQSRLLSSSNVLHTSSWIKKITLATDHHCCNVELEAEKEGLILEVKKNIATGEPLLMWFGERFRAILDIPFLTGCHIEENLTYKCHLCDRIFDKPNPLKLHIALKCDQLNINYIWQTLAIKYSKPSFLMTDILRNSNNFAYQRINLQTSHQGLTCNDFGPKILNPLLSSNSKSAFSLCSQTSDIMVSEINDSFRNFMIVSSTAESCTNIMSPMLLMNRQLKLKSDITKNNDRISAFRIVSNYSTNNLNDYKVEKLEIDYNNEEDKLHISNPLILENEASSSGKTNDGNYQCLICHKRYSRKYGLKIHFRTHTGYKPLTCKYCGRAFGDPSNLNKHVRLHLNSENARYKCKYCEKGMVRRRDLERHIQKKHCIA